MKNHINKIAFICLMLICSNSLAKNKKYYFYNIGDTLERRKDVKVDDSVIVIYQHLSPLCVNCYNVNGVLLDSCDCPYKFSRDEFYNRSKDGLGFISKSLCVKEESPNRYVFKCHIKLIDSSYVKDATIRVISFFRSFSDRDVIIFTETNGSKIKFKIKGMQIQNLVQFDKMRFIVHYSDSRFNIYRFGVIELKE